MSVGNILLHEYLLFASNRNKAALVTHLVKDEGSQLQGVTLSGVPSQEESPSHRPAALVNFSKIIWGLSLLYLISDRDSWSRLHLPVRTPLFCPATGLRPGRLRSTHPDTCWWLIPTLDEEKVTCSLRVGVETGVLLKR